MRRQVLGLQGSELAALRGAAAVLRRTCAAAVQVRMVADAWKDDESRRDAVVADLLRVPGELERPLGCAEPQVLMPRGETAKVT